MLPQKVITKKQKKQNFRKNIIAFVIFAGLIIFLAILLCLAFFQKPPKFYNPLSKDQISTGSRIQKMLVEKKIDFESVVTLKDLTYKIVIDKNSEVIIDPKKDIETQLSSLQVILSALKIEGKMFKRLDFRYRKPVILY